MSHILAQANFAWSCVTLTHLMRLMPGIISRDLRVGGQIEGSQKYHTILVIQKLTLDNLKLCPEFWGFQANLFVDIEVKIYFE